VSYEPTFPGENITPQWLYDELQRVGTGMRQPAGLLFDVLHVEPERPQDGTLVFADGTDWNPGGGGGGLYQRVAGAWVKL
jgi:hypothetical protein